MTIGKFSPTSTRKLAPNPTPEKKLTAIEFFNRAEDKFEKGDYSGAIADYTQAIKLNPDFAGAYYARGIARSDLKDYQGAIANYSEAIKLNPYDAGAYYARGNARRKLKDYSGVIADYTKQQAREDFHTAADLYQQQGNMEWYQQALNRLQELE